MRKKLPVLFISHGAPDILLQKDAVLDIWRQQLSGFERPAKILIVSAHWDTHTIQLGANLKQQTIHDFSGFPAALYELKYSPITERSWADTLAADLSLEVDYDRGLDHGSWVPLIALYPEADIPVVQLSVSSNSGCDAHYKIGQKLAKLRAQGVLIIASGVIVHNLATFHWSDINSPAEDWAIAFMNEFQGHVDRADWNDFPHPWQLSHGQHAVPTLEHYLPFLVAVGAAGTDNARVFCDVWRYANLSMHSYRLG